MADFAQPPKFPQSHRHPLIPLKSGKSIINSYSFTILKRKRKQFRPPTLLLTSAIYALTSGSNDQSSRAGMGMAREDGAEGSRSEWDTLRGEPPKQGHRRAVARCPHTAQQHRRVLLICLFCWGFLGVLHGFVFFFPLIGAKWIPYQQMKCRQLLLTLVNTNLAVLWTFAWHLPEALDLHLPPTLPFASVYSN